MNRAVVAPVLVFAVLSLVGADRPRPTQRRGANTAAVGAPAGFTNGLSAAFDGVDEDASASDGTITECTASDEFTACAWIYPEDNGTQFVFAKLTTAFLMLKDSGSNWYARAAFYSSDCSTGFGNSDETGTHAYDAWYHVCMVLDAGGTTDDDRVSVYVDGSDVAVSHSGPDWVQWHDCADDWFVGSSGTDRYFARNIDEVYTWCEALDASEVSCVHNGGAVVDALACADTTPTVALRMGDGDTHPTLTNRGSGGDFGLRNTESADFVAEVP